MRLAGRLALLLAFAGQPAAAQPVVHSAAPDSVEVTIYRDPGRSADELIDLEEPLGGYALITETRTVELPPGPVTIRFEGVASGIQPESAIVRGVDPAEKNQDRLLLSRRGLLDAFTGQRVIVRRTDPATGRKTEEPARLRSGTNGVVIETAAGFESLHCTYLNQAPIFPRVPAGLSAKPVLSVTTGEQPGGRRQVSLSYLTANFDWQANYVGELSSDSRRLDLFAWVTLASRDQIGLVRAQANAVAGRVERARRASRGDEESEEEDEYDPDDGWEDKYSNCWPSGRTGPAYYQQPFAPDRIPEIEAPIAIRADDYDDSGFNCDSCVLTGSRLASQEALGDLKLYRIPFPVTVASHSQKQVAFLSRPRVKGELVYRSEIEDGDEVGDPQLLFRFRNLREDGLGQSLPTGQVTLFQTVGGRRLLLGETTIEDKAVGEEVELRLPESEAVEAEIVDLEEGEDWSVHRLQVANANDFPIRFEAEFEDDSYHRYERFGSRVREEDRKKIWSVRVLAHGRARLKYRKVDIQDE
ncbi:MAG TPA: hypothetical protein VE053_04945 [Allosphingosinicella sp.]|nr:hypothetical protein [Allosphingosinicella sp.]